MNEYSASMPLWDDEGHTDGEDLRLSEALRSDLGTFASRWNSSIRAEVYDDRFDHIPVLMRLVDALRSLRRLANPAERRAAEAADAELRNLGEELRDRLQDELGASYHVTYRH